MKSNKFKWSFCISLLYCIVFSFIWIGIPNYQTNVNLSSLHDTSLIQTKKNLKKSPYSSQSEAALSTPSVLSSHLSISIYGNDWTTCDVVTGSGTKEDPYIIANIEINGSGEQGIGIYDSNVYGIIKNCTINSASFKNGIYLQYSSNIIIQDCYISLSQSYGIRTFHTEDIQIQNNQISNIRKSGMLIRYSSNYNISSNIFKKSLYYGTLIENCSDFLVKNNSFIKNRVGIYLDGPIFEKTSYRTSIIDNYLKKNIDDAIIDNGINTILVNNTIIKPIQTKITVSRNKVFCGEEISFSGYPSGGLLPYLEFKWEFDDGSTSSELNCSHIYVSPGSYLVNFSVRDNENDIGCALQVINVEFDLIPMADFSVSQTSFEVDKEITFTFTGTMGNLPMKYFWDFGDGNSSTLRDPVHIYKEPGNYTIVLTVIDENGDNSTCSKILPVYPKTNSSDVSFDNLITNLSIKGYSLGYFSTFLIIMIWIVAKKNKNQRKIKFL
ncbi:MAG: right-handed parallel beta-helix repeat-containing protein [Candidatus Lokiarchaeota archaeon]|nr:right-handed parallel beta-helix repeat-containing protein [Candidatus Harpocratesius repetitus]